MLGLKFHDRGRHAEGLFSERSRRCEQAIEGGGFASRIIIIEFDSPDQVMAWYNCPEYQAIMPIRHANATTRAACLLGA